MKEKGKITKKMTFASVLQRYPQLSRIFLKHGMACIYCPIASQETIEQGCKAHGIKPDSLVKELNEELRKKRRRR